MKVEQSDMLSLLGKENVRFSVPVYQRPYTWEHEQLEVLWADALRAARTGSPHFTGTVFFAPSPSDEGTTELALIDGQQRMVSLYLMVNTLAKHLSTDPSISNELDEQVIRDTYLMSNSACKLSVSRPDRRSIDHVVLDTVLPPEEEQSEVVLNNHAWLLAKMQSADFSADELWYGLGLLQVITVEAQEGDRAQSIFETLNAKGMPLSECEERFAIIHHERDRTTQRIGMHNRVFGD